MFPRIVVVVPTRNRADTLRSCLKTFGACDYPNLGMVVANNASDDDTLEVIDSIRDSRIKVISTDRRVGMSQNFEFALQDVLQHEDDSAYVTIIGDDDGVLNLGFERIGGVLAEFSGIEAFTWRYPGYSWPSVVDKAMPNVLDVPLDFTGPTARDAGEVFQSFVSGKVRYTDLARVYHGLVRVSLLRRLVRNGRLIHAMAPDIYLGVVSTLSVEKIVEIPFPLTINGASGHSTGSLAVIGGKPRKAGSQASQFYAEANLDPHPSVGMVPPTLRICEFESLQFARDLGFWSGQVEPGEEFHLMLKEGVGASAEQVLKIEAVLEGIASFFKWESFLSAEKDAFDAGSSVREGKNRLDFDFGWNRVSKRFRVKCDQFKVSDIEGAVRIADFLYRFREFIEGDQARESGVSEFCDVEGLEAFASLRKENERLKKKIKQLNSSVFVRFFIRFQRLFAR